MAGHSKWANRKHRKARQDAKKGKIFSKMAKKIAVAARQGGPDPDTNTSLRLAIEEAKQYSVPQENIDRAIKRGAGEQGGADYEEIVYEGYGPGGTAILLQILTDNRNRTAAEIRHLFSRHGGNLGETGSVAWVFDRKGLLVIDRTEQEVDEEEVLLLAAEAGGEDVKADEESIQVITAPEDFERVKKSLEDAGLRFTEAGISMIPKNEVEVGGKEAEQLLRLLDALEDHDDVQEVYSNSSIDDEVLAQFG